MTRDPRVDPQPGDLLKVGGLYGQYYFVLPHDPHFQHNDISFLLDGREFQISLFQWRNLFKEAECFVPWNEAQECPVCGNKYKCCE